MNFNKATTVNQSSNCFQNPSFVAPSDPHHQVFFDNFLMDYKQAARFLCISLPYLRRLKAQGSIPFVNIGSRGVRFNPISLKQWIEKREVK